MIGEEVKEQIKKAAIKNALSYGKAKQSAVMNSVLAIFPELKTNLKELSKGVDDEVSRINALDKAQLASEAGPYAAEFRSDEKGKAAKASKPKLELEGAVKGNFFTRFAPEPNGYMQIGHAKISSLERELANTYSGRMALYFDDTNPEAEKQEFVDAFKADLKWLGIECDAEYYASDNIDKMYAYAEQLIKKSGAYVCDCSPEDVKGNRTKGMPCPHKGQSREQNLSKWKAMLDGGSTSGILRLNGDLQSLNTAMRDPTLFRIKTEPHYRQGNKYKVWPTYDFNTPIMDSINGITDAMRSKEYELRDELYRKILDLLGLRKPRIHSIARLEFRNNVTSKRKINELISKGKLWGYDDPRLVTIAGLRRRGISPKAIKSFVLRFGLSKTESKMDMTMLLDENRKVIDGSSKRLFFVDDPIKLTADGVPKEKLKVSIKSHPKADLGARTYDLSSEFFINAYDASTLKKGDKLRLKDAFDIEIEEKEKNAISAKYVPTADAKTQKVQWVNNGNYLKCKALIIGDLLLGESFNDQSIKAKDGLVEAHANDLKEGDIVQFERVGFFKLDSKAEMVFLSL